MGRDDAPLQLELATGGSEYGWCWGYARRPLLPATLTRALRRVPSVTVRVGDRQVRFAAHALATGHGLPRIPPIGARVLALDVLEHLIDESRDAILTTAVFDGSIEPNEAIAVLPFLHATIDTLHGLGQSLTGVAEVLPELTLGELVDWLKGDRSAALDLSMTTIGWLHRNRVGGTIVPPSLDEFSLEQFAVYATNQLFVAAGRTPKANQFVALATRLGWVGEGPSTLDVAGRAANLTRERVRQLELVLVPPAAQRQCWPAPSALKDALGLLTAMCPCDVSDAESLLSKPTGEPTSVATVLALAELAGLNSNLKIGDASRLTAGGLSSADEAELAQAVWKASGKIGFATLDEVVAYRRKAVPTLTREEVDAALDSARRIMVLPDGWFFSAGSDASVVGLSRRMLAVRPALRVETLRAGLARRLASRRWPPPPPVNVLQSFYEQHAAFEVDADVVTAVEPLSPDRSDVQWQIVDILTASPGCVMHSEEVVAQGRARGLRVASVGRYLMTSELFEKVAPMTFAPVGTEPTADSIARARARVIATGERFLSETWYDTSGRLIIAGALTRRVCNSGAIPLSGEHASALGEDRFRVVENGAEASGEVHVGINNYLHGFQRYFRLRNAQPGEVLRIAFDFGSLVASVELGNDELLTP